MTETDLNVTETFRDTTAQAGDPTKALCPTAVTRALCKVISPQKPMVVVVPKRGNTPSRITNIGLNSEGEAFVGDDPNGAHESHTHGAHESHTLPTRLPL